jgi:hypothetical protein
MPFSLRRESAQPTNTKLAEKKKKNELRIIDVINKLMSIHSTRTITSPSAARTMIGMNPNTTALTTCTANSQLNLLVVSSARVSATLRLRWCKHTAQEQCKVERSHDVRRFAFDDFKPLWTNFHHSSLQIQIALQLCCKAVSKHTTKQPKPNLSSIHQSRRRAWARASQ